MKLMRRQHLLAGCLVSLLACGDDPTQSAGGSDYTSGPYLIVGMVSTDFQTGAYGLVDLATMAPQPELGNLYPDSVLRWRAGILLAINRFGADNLQRIDPVTLATRWQYSTGSGSNPQGVAVIDEHRAYVSLYEEARLLVVDLDPADESGFILDDVDLSAFADADGIPEATALLALGGTVWLTLQRLDRDDLFAPTNDSLLVGLEAATGAIVDLDPSEASDALTLPVVNPIQMRSDGDDTLWIACSGAFGELDGAIVPFSVSTRTFGDPIIEEADLGGDLTAFTMSSPAYVLWTDEAFSSHVSVVDPATRSVTGALASDLGNTGDIEVDADRIYLSDRNPTAPGIRVFSRDDHAELTTEPIETGLPPLSIEIVEP